MSLLLKGACSMKVQARVARLVTEEKHNGKARQCELPAPAAKQPRHP